MMLNLVLMAIAVILGLSAIGALAVVADRNARAAAWRQIALERRWNHDQRQRG